MKTKKQLPSSLFSLFVLMLLCVLGLFFVFEASVAQSFSQFGHQYHFFYRQLQWFGVGVVAFIFGFFIPLSWLKRLSKSAYIFGLIMLLLVFIPGIGLEINGARRWFSIGGFSIQPVEFFKVSLVLFFANWLSVHQRVLPLLFSIAIPSLILLFQPDFGSMLVIIFIAFGIYFVSGGSVKKLLPVGLVTILLLIALIISSPYRFRRVQTFFNPESDPLGVSFQIRQITLALGSGGWFGQGLGNSQQKNAFIPEASSDSIFAIIGEEVGFVGSVFLIGLFSIHIHLLFKVSLKLEEGSFEQLLMSGLWLWVGGQALLNLSAVVALVPLTGLTLPYFSYGGSSLVSLLFFNGVGYKLSKTNK